MSLIDYGRIILRRGWIMILLAALAAGAAFVFSRQMTPVYRATQTVLLVPSRSDFGLAEATLRLLNSHVAYLRSELRAAEVIDLLNLDMTPGQLMSNVTIAPDRDSLAVVIDVDMAGVAEIAGKQAADIARTWGDLLIQYRNDLNQQAQRQDRIETARQDDPRPGLLRPNLTINTLAGGIGGFFLGAVLVFVLEFLENNLIRRRDDLDRLEIAVLATIPDHL